MAYQLGIDLGTTYTAAAVAVDGRVEPLNLGTRSPVLPTVVFARPATDGAEGELLVGDAAETRGVLDPTRVGREFKRRLGDPAPLMLGGTPYPAEALMGAVLAHVHHIAVERMGAEPDHVVITHPATYSNYRLDLLRDAVRRAGFASSEFLTEPQAAATHYASLGRLEVGDVLAVYDLGGGTFDAAIVRNTGHGFELLGEPHGLERLGGIDFDIAVLEHVNEQMGGQLGTLPDDDPAVRAGLARLRADARHAKEVLSDDTDARIPLVVPGVVGEVTLSRAELERLVVPRIRESIDVLRRAITSAKLTPDDLTAVLLVGGSSRIPAVREMVGQALRVRVTADIDPEMAVALGAARHAALQAAPAPVAAPPPPAPAPPAPPAPAPPVAPPPVAPPPAAFVPPAAPAPGRSGRSKRLLVVGGVAAALIAAIVAVVVLASGGSDPQSKPDETDAPAPTDAPDDTVAPDETTDGLVTAEGCDLFVALLADPGASVDDLRGEGANGCDLTGADLSARDLSGIDFGRATLDGANFDDSDVSGALFLDATLTGTSFLRATMGATDFTGADLSGTVIEDASAAYAVFDNVTMRGASLVTTDCTGCSFEGAVLVGSDVAGTNFSGAAIVNADMESVGIDGAVIDLSSVVGPAPGTVLVLNDSGRPEAFDEMASPLQSLGYIVEDGGAIDVGGTTRLSCQGGFAGSEMRKLTMVVDNFFFSNVEELDWNSLEEAAAITDESIACVIVIGADLTPS